MISAPGGLSLAEVLRIVGDCGEKELERIATEYPEPLTDIEIYRLLR